MIDREEYGVMVSDVPTRRENLVNGEEDIRANLTMVLEPLEVGLSIKGRRWSFDVSGNKLFLAAFDDPQAKRKSQSLQSEEPTRRKSKYEDCERFKGDELETSIVSATDGNYRFLTDDSRRSSAAASIHFRFASNRRQPITLPLPPFLSSSNASQLSFVTVVGCRRAVVRVAVSRCKDPTRFQVTVQYVVKHWSGCGSWKLDGEGQCLNLYYLTDKAYGGTCALRISASFGSTRPIGASFGSTRRISASFGSTRLIGASFGSTRLIGASFGSTRLICASFGSTRLICASFESTRLICAFYGTTRLLCRGTARGRPTRGRKDA
ncbi:hypothetical protein E6C27_scaffold243G001060 [Cucumis melo var. makuwa]|uniref:Uncharacterized protein n=1 Tax=Cucumis melo var. makuwa TaxID=1194695 RepID=A0A5A7TR50_CUCMM|nr:hypothetical protein E6C27_scaffold243G001060 [Cucumis melo var. makuwa]